MGLSAGARLGPYEILEAIGAGGMGKMARPFDAGSLETTGEAFPIADEVMAVLANGRGIFSVSANGILVYQSSAALSSTELAWFDPNGDKLGTLGDAANFSDSAISPDGTAVAVGIWDQDQAKTDLWIHEVERGVRTRYTFLPGDAADPVWSSDGKRLVFSSTPEGVKQLYIGSIGDSSAVELLFEDGENKQPSDWSKDGRYVVYNNDEDIWALPLSAAAEPFKVIDAKTRAFSGRLSPDGRWIAYTSNDSGAWQVYLTSFPEPGRTWQISADGGDAWGWRPDGGEIYYGRNFGREAHATTVELRDGSCRIGVDRLLFEDARANAVGVTSDTRRVLVALPTVGGEIAPLTLVVNWAADLGG